MKDLFSGMGYEERTQRRDAQCGTCRWYNGIFDCCRYPRQIRRDGGRCVSWRADTEVRRREP